MHRYATCFLLWATLSVPALARAGEADDLQRSIQDYRQTANDLERLDEQKAAGTELTFLRSWLDRAWDLRGQEKYDEVRVITDRCRAQADMNSREDHRRQAWGAGHPEGSRGGAQAR